MTEPQEPRLVRSIIPYVGHIISFCLNKHSYWVQLSRAHPELPILTLWFLNQKVYLITKPELLQAAHKLPNALTFPPIEASFAIRLCGLSPEATSIMNYNLNGEEGEVGLSRETVTAMRTALSPGPEFEEMNQVTFDSLAESLNYLRRSNLESERIDFLEWCRDEVTIAFTDAVYGPQNPFNNKIVRDAFWELTRNLTPLLVGILPSFTARKGVEARATFAEAFEQYYRNEGHKKGSLLARSRYEVATKNGVPLKDTAKLEASGAIAILASTVPASSLMLFFIYSKPDLLKEIRAELDPIVRSRPSDDGPTRVFSIKSLKQHCPLFMSIFHETLRYCSTGTSVRQVIQDTILDGKWLLKKGSIVQIPSHNIHTDPSLWGDDDVYTFEPKRFMNSPEPNTSSSGAQKRPSTANVRAFGGGIYQCPGRQYVTNGILALASMFALRFDMMPVMDASELSVNTRMSMVGAIMELDRDFEMDVLPRMGFEEMRLACSLEDSEVVIGGVEADLAT
ncbi:hypothetical protein ACLMJK_007541 [Lecanora helva]